MGIALGGFVVYLLIRSNSVLLVGHDPGIEWYRLADQRTIVLTVDVPPQSWTRVTNVAESRDEVRITVECFAFPIPGPGTAKLDGRDLRVSLSNDLGARRIEDANGQQVPKPLQ